MNNIISFERLLKLIKQNLHILIIWTVGIFSIAAFYTSFVLEPAYQSVSRIVVNNTPAESSAFTNSEINTNLSLINTYEGIIVEPIILEKVVEETNTNVSAGQLRGKISFQRDSETSLIFGIVVTDSEPERAAQLANATAEVFQREVVEILPVNSSTILSEATPNYSPISPNKSQDMMFGLMAGVLIGFMHIFLKDLTDKRVKSEEIISELEWLNLGSVSEMTSREVEETSIAFSNEMQKNFDELIPRTLKDRGVKYE